ncbi:MAG: hypothetical protein IK119_08865 [Bacteroidales bacterium]|nr:hypothetical protein [Bacteroidales bacterium]
MHRFIQLLVLLLLVPLRAVAEEPLYKDFQELQLRLEEAHSRMVLIRVIFIAALIIIIVVFQYLRLRDRRKREAEREENERIMAIAEDLRARLADAESAASAASAQKTSMLEKMGFSVLERLCEQYYIYEGTDNLQPKLLKEAKAVIEDLRSDAGQLEKTLDGQKNGLISKFRAQLPKVREEEVRLFCFLAAGFNSTTISTLMEKDKQNIYNKIWRLKTRISESDAPDKDLFLTYFSK